MIDIFRDEYFWMLKEECGYFPWVNSEPWRLFKKLNYNLRIVDELCFHRRNSRALINFLLEEEIYDNPLCDLFTKALIRAELRLLNRYIPQGSNEERLTGHLVSEIDNSLFLIKDIFHKRSQEKYAEKKEIDFFYYDLSRGGHIEKETGADLGFILVVDLPDFPFTVKTLILQAKKIYGNSVQLNKTQYETLKHHDDSGTGYLFYDMDLSRLSSPMVVPLNSFTQKYEECNEKENQSFSIDFNNIKRYGTPLSLFLLAEVLYSNNIGTSHNSFKLAFKMFQNLYSKNDNISFNGRLAIVSIGRSINYSINHDIGMDINI